MTLPEFVAIAAGESALRPVYEMQVDLGPAPRAAALYVPGLLNRARVQVNGHTVVDALREPDRSGPRGADRLLFATVPDEWLQPGINRIEIALEARRRTSLSKVWIGPESQLRPLYDRKLWWQVHAPVVSAAIIFALSGTVLLLWLRRREETLYGFFGVGGVVWSLHSVWGVLSDPLLPYPHFAIWWNLGFGFFVAPIVVFCIRLAHWRLPYFERSLWVALALGPAVVYAANAANVLDSTLMLWRLGWVGVVAIGAMAVGYFAWQRRGLHAVLLVVAAATAFAFGLSDWLTSAGQGDNNPVLLTYFSGLAFFPLVASMLIDGFVHAARDLERLNADLERRVAAKSVELRAALESMRIAKETAEGADRAKSSFLAAASHDLRQPMNALGLYMAALRAERDTAARDDLIERMEASMLALDSLFDALLDISRIDAGAIEPQPRAFALEPMLRRLCDEFASQAADHALRLALRIDARSRELNALSDPLLVERIVRNLLGNAVKYTRSGGVLLACRLRSADTPQPFWRIEVWDSGPGIPEAEFERVFEEFYQLGNRERNRAAGLGLGLSIVRRLARLLGHPLALHSRTGRGSRFRIDLPATEAPAIELAADPDAGESVGSIARLGVAVIDDDPAVRDSMTELLTRWGCDVVAGSTGEEVLAQAGEYPARRLHAALVDFQLSDGRNGIDAIRTLRGACGEGLPALLLSGASSAARLAEVRASGHAWLSKPVRAARLHGWLAQAAGRNDA
ncbi:MAG: hybrid sensor histidine kinase/response regulator [Burkholderiaceae bacterium]